MSNYLSRYPGPEDFSGQNSLTPDVFSTSAARASMEENAALPKQDFSVDEGLEPTGYWMPLVSRVAQGSIVELEHPYKDATELRFRNLGGQSSHQANSMEC